MPNSNTISATSIASELGGLEQAYADARDEASAMLRGYDAPRVTLAVTLAQHYADGGLQEWSPTVARAVVTTYAVAAGRPAPQGQSLAVQASKLGVCVKAGKAFVDTISNVKAAVRSANDKNKKLYLKDAQNKVASIGRACLARGRALSHEEMLAILTDSATDDEKVFRLLSTAASALSDAVKIIGSEAEDFTRAIDAVDALVDRWKAVAESAKRARVDAMSRMLDAGRSDVDAEAEAAIPEGSADALPF